jgi:hypothetical protein
MILKFKIILAFQYISFLKSIWHRFQNKMYWNEEHFVYNVIIILIICYNYLLVYIVSLIYRDHFRNLSIVSKVLRNEALLSLDKKMTISINFHDTEKIDYHASH